ncbi:4-hydroxythreonine-4-phosphate dehydrogenase PdxA [candidate division WOR-3 bacterium]|nr:4-hydroxythreonine-4-phosphate dehydrogenase PdxA [candidate division WOR-3 bacterium]
MKTAITLGDPAGIGPELILRCAPTIAKLRSCVIYGNHAILKKTSQDLKLQPSFKVLQHLIADCTRSKHFQYGKPTRATGMIAMASIDCALADEPDILITPPIVKAVIQKSKPGFIGHTEYFAHYYNVQQCAMVGLWKTKRIMLVTTHMPLRRVFKCITPGAIIGNLQLLAWGLKKYFTIPESCIGVSALNPHGLEFSAGEDEKIEEAVARARKIGIDVHGPFPADSLFNRTYDGFLAMFHDQAMIYLKSKKCGLNFTLGLPIIRLSPLYGAALDIAGKGIAESSGLETAIKMGILLYKNARTYEKTKSVT